MDRCYELPKVSISVASPRDDFLPLAGMVAAWYRVLSKYPFFLQPTNDTAGVNIFSLILT